VEINLCKRNIFFLVITNDDYISKWWWLWTKGQSSKVNKHLQAFEQHVENFDSSLMLWLILLEEVDQNIYISYYNMNQSLTSLIVEHIYSWLRQKRLIKELHIIKLDLLLMIMVIVHTFCTSCYYFDKFYCTITQGFFKSSWQRCQNLASLSSFISTIPIDGCWPPSHFSELQLEWFLSAMLVVAHVVGHVGDVKLLDIAKKSLLKWEVNWQCHVIIWTHQLHVVARKGCWEVVSVVTCEQGHGQLGLGLNSRQ
jgi:hypothetical protein